MCLLFLDIKIGGAVGSIIGVVLLVLLSIAVFVVYRYMHLLVMFVSDICSLIDITIRKSIIKHPLESYIFSCVCGTALMHTINILHSRSRFFDIENIKFSLQETL